MNLIKTVPNGVKFNWIDLPYIFLIEPIKYEYNIGPFAGIELQKSCRTIIERTYTDDKTEIDPPSVHEMQICLMSETPFYCAPRCLSVVRKFNAYLMSL